MQKKEVSRPCNRQPKINGKQTENEHIISINGESPIVYPITKHKSIPNIRDETIQLRLRHKKTEFDPMLF